MKTSDKIMTTLIILAILAAGGYFLYKHFVLDKETYSIEDVEGIEATDIWEGDPYAYDSNIESLLSVCSALKASNANYFTMSYEYWDEWENVTITQADSETFASTIESCESNEMIKNATDDMEYFLSTNFNKINEDFWGEGGNPTLFGPKNVYGIDREAITEGFATDIKQYFLEHEIILNCENVQIKKICAGDLRDEGAYSLDTRFYYIGEAQVTTESANADLSDLGLFGDVGETVTVEFMGVWSGMRHGASLDGCTECFVLNRLD